MTLGMGLRRWLFPWHRWLDVKLGLVFLVWFVSGVVRLLVTPYTSSVLSTQTPSSTSSANRVARR